MYDLNEALATYKTSSFKDVRGNWCTETRVQLSPQFVLVFATHKHSSGLIVSAAQTENGFHVHLGRVNVRATQKNVFSAHQIALGNMRDLARQAAEHCERLQPIAA